MPWETECKTSIGSQAVTRICTAGCTETNRATASGQKMHGGTVQRGDGDVAADGAAQFVDIAAEPCEVVQCVPRVAQHEPAGVSQPHTVRAALKQRCAEMVLQLQNLPVDGRGGDMEALRGTADRSKFSHRLEVT